MNRNTPDGRHSTRRPSLDVEEIVHELGLIDQRRKARKRAGVAVLGGLGAVALLVGSGTIVLSGDGKNDSPAFASNRSNTPAPATSGSPASTAGVPPTEAGPPRSSLELPALGTDSTGGPSPAGLALAFDGISSSTPQSSTGPSHRFIIGAYPGEENAVLDFGISAGTGIAMAGQLSAGGGSGDNDSAGNGGESNGGRGSNGGSGGDNNSGGDNSGGDNSDSNDSNGNIGGGGNSGGDNNGDNNNGDNNNADNDSGGDNNDSSTGGDDNGSGSTDAPGTEGNGPLLSLGLAGNTLAVGGEQGLVNASLDGEGTLGVVGGGGEGAVNVLTGQELLGGDESGLLGGTLVIDGNVNSNAGQGGTTGSVSITGDAEGLLGLEIDLDGTAGESTKSDSGTNAGNTLNLGGLLGSGIGGLLDIGAGPLGAHLGNDGLELESSPETEELIEIDLGGLF